MSTLSHRSMETRFTLLQHSQPTTQPATTREARARLVNATLDFVTGTPLYPQPYEYTLLQLFVEGDLTIDEVVQRLEA
jgi:hypothetical protein